MEHMSAIAAEKKHHRKVFAMLEAHCLSTPLYHVQMFVRITLVVFLDKFLQHEKFNSNLTL